jgi:AraC-like DNA-binding protein
VAKGLLEEPADGRSLGRWGRAVGASEPTSARLFVQERGMGFRAWRLRRRLLQAVHLLTLGHPVTAVALEVGYESPSAFVAAFRRTLGCTPRRYQRETGALTGPSAQSWSCGARLPRAD